VVALLLLSLHRFPLLSPSQTHARALALLARSFHTGSSFIHNNEKQQQQQTTTRDDFDDFDDFDDDLTTRAHLLSLPPILL